LVWQIFKQIPIFVWVKTNMTGIAERDEVLFFAQTAIARRPYVMNVKFEVYIIIWAAAANSASPRVAF
jgi:hypothetical protein